VNHIVVKTRISEIFLEEFSITQILILQYHVCGTDSELPKDMFTSILISKTQLGFIHKMIYHIDE